MNNKLRNTLNFPLFILLFIPLLSANAQIAAPFKIRYQGNIKGDMTMISNAIVNRKTATENTNIPYNTIDRAAKRNDEFEMEYIDIDQDMSTFSSSSAILNIKNSLSSKIVYAGLYWSATYKFNQGKQKKINVFTAVDKKREIFNEIKIKFPNRNDYTTVKGEIIYDGLNDLDFEDSAPYAVYKDITEEVKSLENPNGEYTVANIKSTIGMLSGGVAAGWTILFVYEDTNSTEKHITTYDGFAGVTKKNTDIVFSGFKTVPTGNVNAKIAGAALEGDLTMKGDQMLFKANHEGAFMPIENAIRRPANFFNSSITIDGDYFMERNPNSLNTLGYDSFLTQIHNPENRVIENNAQQAIIQLKSTGDRYFMFMCALNIEVANQIPAIASEQKNTLTAQSIQNESNPKTSVSKEKKEVVSNLNSKNKFNTEKTKLNFQNGINSNKSIVNSNNKESIKKSKSNKQKENELSDNNSSYESTKNSQDISSISEVYLKTDAEKSLTNNEDLKSKDNLVRVFKSIEKIKVTDNSTPKGFYIVANVFSKPSFANSFLESLKNKNFKADFFINPKNNYRYVYLNFFNSKEEAEKIYFSNINNTYFDDLWIMEVE